MGAIYLSRGRFNRAAENFEDAIKVLISGGPEEDPHVAMAYYNLGLCWAQMGVPKADSSLRRALSIAEMSTILNFCFQN